MQHLFRLLKGREKGVVIWYVHNIFSDMDHF